ncbi:coil containing protein [Vibrio phage 1.262.O._10N.286.51.A9]|nr:coil containing protein [Vibrio phage 1.262.O._10N.286.51.A9]
MMQQQEVPQVQEVQQPANGSVQDFLYVWDKQQQNFAQQQQLQQVMQQQEEQKQKEAQFLQEYPRQGAVPPTQNEVMLPPEVLGGVEDGRPIIEEDVIEPLEVDNEFMEREEALQSLFDEEQAGLLEDEFQEQELAPLTRVMKGRESNSNADIYGENKDLWGEDKQDLPNMTVQEVIDEGRSTLRKVHKHNRDNLKALKDGGVVTADEYKKYNEKPWLIDRAYWEKVNKKAKDAGLDNKLRIPSAASGTYQFTTTTLMDMMKGGVDGVSPDDKFDDTTQEKLALARMRQSKAVSDYIDGNSDDIDTAVKEFGNIWEAFKKDGNKQAAKDMLNEYRNQETQVAQTVETPEVEAEVISERNTPTETSTNTASVNQEYQVRGGDTLGKIAKAHNTTVPQLMALNPSIKNPNKISEGQNIRVS